MKTKAIAALMALTLAALVVAIWSLDPGSEGDLGEKPDASNTIRPPIETVPAGSTAQTGASAQPEKPLAEWEKLTRQAMDLTEAGKAAEAKPVAEQAVASAEREFGPNTINVATALSNLAGVKFALGEFEASHADFKKAEAIMLKVLPEDSLELVPTLNNHALLLKNMNRAAEAEQLYFSALLIQAKRLPRNHPEIGITENNVAELLKQIGQLEAAERNYLEAIKIFKSAYGPDSPRLIPILENIAGLYRQMNQPEKAAASLQEVIKILDGADSPDRQRLIQVLENIAGLYQQMNQPEKAAAFLQRIDAIKSKASVATPP